MSIDAGVARRVFEASERLENAIASVIEEGVDVTYDMKMDKSGGVGTSRVAEAIIEKLNKQ